MGLSSGLGRWSVPLPFARHYLEFFLRSINFSHSLVPSFSPYIDRNLEGGRGLRFYRMWEIRTTLLRIVRYPVKNGTACLPDVFLVRKT
jgi:hypothetical protein